MKTKKANVGLLQFGYWDVSEEEFVPVNAENVDELREDAAVLGCSELLLDALAMFAAQISSMVSTDLNDIWQRLDDLEANVKGAKNVNR